AAPVSIAGDQLVEYRVQSAEDLRGAPRHRGELAPPVLADVAPDPVLRCGGHDARIAVGDPVVQGGGCPLGESGEGDLGRCQAEGGAAFLDEGVDGWRDV